MLTTLQALESKCHTGQTILYDTVTVKGWSVDVRTHRIGEIINKILVDPWPGTEGDPGKPEVAESSWSWWGWGRKGPGRHRRRDGPEDEDDGWNKHGGVPEAEPEDECIDCFKWCVNILARQLWY